MKHSTKRKSRKIRKAAYEVLEDRKLMSTVSLHQGVLTVAADSHTASKLEVTLSNDGKQITGYATGAKQTVEASAVKKVIIIGSTGADRIYIDPKLTLPTEISAGAGNDTIYGSSGKDVIDAGPGNDLVYGGNGDDQISGGEGNDTIYGGAGNDNIDGGAGNDQLYGNEGNDTIGGGAGNDLIRGDAGNDLLVGGDGHDTIKGDQGNDVLYGSAGNDVLEGNSGDDRLDGGTGLNKLDGGAGNDRLANTGATGEVTVVQPGKVETPKPTQTSKPTTNQTPTQTTPAPTTPAPTTPTQNTTPAPTAPVVTPIPATSTTPATNTNASTPSAVITALSQVGVVGHAVHVHALESQLNGGTALTARYQWNFGDTGSAYNTLTGFNAAHIYDKAGSYTITLTVTNEGGKSNVATFKVNVAAENRKEIYVDANGSDSNSGLDANNAVRSVDKAISLLGNSSNVSILFRRGQTFELDKSIIVNGKNVMIGAYGNGDRPVLQRVLGTGLSAIRTNPQAFGVIVQDITFDSPYVAKNGVADKTGVSAIYAGGTNITVRGCQFLNVDDAVNGDSKPTGLLVQDNIAPSATGLRGYFVWMDGSDIVILGNKVANSTREHILRCSSQTTSRILVANNDLTNIGRSSTDSGDIAKTTVNFRIGSYIYMTNDKLTGGPVSVGPSHTQAIEDTAQWLVLEDSTVSGASLEVFPNTWHLTARNNVFQRDNNQLILLEPQQAGYGERNFKDINIIGNTGIDNGATGKFIKVTGEAAKGSITVKNNLFVAPLIKPDGNMAAGIQVQAKNLDGFAEISHNIWPVSGINFVYAGSNNTAGYKSNLQWEAYEQVQDDSFMKISLVNGVQTIVNGVVVGAKLAA